MKALLINSPLYDKKIADKEDYLPPFGLGYIATNLKNNNIDVSIIDAVYENYTIEELLQIIEKEKPDAVGINIFSVNNELVKKLIENCKTQTKFIVGGKNTKFMYNEIMNYNTNNEIVITIGEGDYITSDIINNNVKQEPIISKNKRKVYVVNNDSPYFPKDLSQTKLDRSFFKDRQINGPYGTEEGIITSRECLYNCAFCGGARSLNKDVIPRTRNKEDIIKELDYIKTNHPQTECIRILDDLFLKNTKSIKQAIEIFKNYDFKWRAMSHINTIKNEDKLLEALYESGCQELEIGIESGSDRIRKYIHKLGTTDDIVIGITKLLKVGINVKGYFMYGFPTETKEEGLETYNLAKKLTAISKHTKGKFRTSAFQFRPYHGTELYNKINKKLNYHHDNSLNKLKGRNQFNFSAGNFSKYSDALITLLITKTMELEKEEINEKQNSSVSKMSIVQKPKTLIR